jgi:type II restriction/modification system DNA methylase subunit YeeA
VRGPLRLIVTVPPLSTTPLIRPALTRGTFSRPNSGSPEFGNAKWPKSETSDFGWEKEARRGRLRSLRRRREKTAAASPLARLREREKGKGGAASHPLPLAGEGDVRVSGRRVRGPFYARCQILANCEAMTPQEFIKKWKPVALTERASAHEHFLDLCRLLEHPTPAEDDPTGEHFAFEKGATKTGGGEGFADVWKRGHFAWEYKKKKRDLNAALEQLVRYAAALENPPLQVACDTDRFVIRTAWTNAVPKIYELELDDLSEPKKLDILRSVFTDPEKLRPKETRAGITKEAADKFSGIALRLQGKGTPEQVAHFVNQLVFCFFANSVKLLPDGFFPKLLKRVAQRPERAQEYFNQLFAAMETGGEFDLTDIAWFNGGLFDGRRALPLDSGDIGLLQAAASLDWSLIDPTIFGTLFERFLDPDKRAQIGAHYTDPEKIMMIVEPVILRPLREEWAIARAEIEEILAVAEAKLPKTFGRGADKAVSRAMAGPISKAEAIRSRFVERLRTLTILDPACGSGNFLYLALQGVKDLELRANLECQALGLPAHAPMVGPEIVHGIEINALAAELARTTIWIGDIQWRLRNGIHVRPQPILRELDAIERRDALVSVTNDGVVEAEWPMVDFIIGNPPFLGAKEFLSGFGEPYTGILRDVFKDKVDSNMDYVSYWFYKAAERAPSGGFGFVATDQIRKGVNVKIIDQAVQKGFRITEAWSDQPWILEGANIRVSIVCLTKQESQATLNGSLVDTINSGLQASHQFDLSRRKRLQQNARIAFVGSQKDGDFDLKGEIARDFICAPLNPNGRPNSDVIRPWSNGDHIVGVDQDRWIIDFGEMAEGAAKLYERPFEYLFRNVKEARSRNRDKRRREKWWLLGRPGSRARSHLTHLSRMIVCSLTSKHRVFRFSPVIRFPDNSAVVIARDDPTTFGILHSRFHSTWALRTGTGRGVTPRYTPTTTFDTFPFPEGLTPDVPADGYKSDPGAISIARAAERLDVLRNNWLRPPDLVLVEPEVVPGYPDRILPKDVDAAAKLRERTLTNLYNQRPQWLVDAHRDLDAAVAAAYGWPADISEEDALAKLLELNLARADVSGRKNASGADEDELDKAAAE